MVRPTLETVSLKEGMERLEVSTGVKEQKLLTKRMARE